MDEAITLISIIWTIFKKKIHIPVKDVQLKYLKGIISKVISSTPLKKFTVTKKRFFTEIYNGECFNLFSIWNTLGIHRAIIQSYHTGLLQYKIPVDITFFSRVLKHDKLKGSFQLRNFSYF